MSTKRSRSGSPNTMKSEEMNDSAEPSVREDIGEVPVIHASRTEENALQLIQLLHALDQPGLFGWPLMAPVKVPLQKCKKCPLEFCSPINYRRHIRVHRQSSIVNKESNRNKDLLAAFWDKLPLEKAVELVAFNEATLKEIPGASIVTALASSLCNPAVWALPHVYVRAGSLLLDIIQATPSRQPISSQELFDILEDASEKTFLCGGTPESVQNYLFDGEATKTCLELKNLVASASFLFEQQLVKAWVADKEAEALRCQKLLVEEEEAAKKRLAELSKRKKQKKLRQKEHKLKELSHQCKGDLNVAVNAAESPVLEVSVPSCPSASSPSLIFGLENRDSALESLQDQDEGPEAQIDISTRSIIQWDSETVESQIACKSNSAFEPEGVDAGLESQQSPAKDLEGQNVSRGGDQETVKCQIEILEAGSESPQNLGNYLEAHTDISNDDNKRGETENIESQMADETISICGHENVKAGVESPQKPEKEVEAQNDLSIGVSNHMLGESASIHGSEKVESPKSSEKNLKAAVDVSCAITTGETKTVDSHEACGSNQETCEFYSISPLHPSLVDEDCHHDHTVGSKFEVLIGSISVEVNVPWSVVIGDVVVFEKAGYPILLCKGSPTPTPYDHCGNHDPSPTSVAAPQEFLSQRYNAAVGADYVVLAR